MTLGGRYTYDDKMLDGTTNDAFASILGTTGFSFKQDYDGRAFTPRLVLAWDNGDTNIFFYSFTRGFKSGGFPG